MVTLNEIIIKDFILKKAVKSLPIHSIRDAIFPILKNRSAQQCCCVCCIFSLF